MLSVSERKQHTGVPPRIRSEHDSIPSFLTQTLSPAERAHIAVLSFNQWSFALAGVVEVALGAKEMGCEVTVCLWTDYTPVKDSGWTTSHFGARFTRNPAIDIQVQNALLDFGFDSSHFAQPPIRRWRNDSTPIVRRGITRSQVRQLSYKGSPLGRAILQVHPDAKTPFREDFIWPTRWLTRAAKSYAWVYDQTTELIKQRGITTIVVFNGRFLHDNAAAAAALALGVRVLYGETGGIETDFDVSTASTHDMDHVQRRMLAMYATWPEPDQGEPHKRVIGETWFRNRQTHSDPEVQLFVGDQEFGDLGEVEKIPQTEKLVVFFSSSGDEIAELELDWNKFFQSQEGAISELAAACADLPGVMLAVRTHPHLRIKPPDDLARWKAAVERAGVPIHIDPNSKVDSYALMKRADIVVSYGSTSGVEAAFLGRPSILMGPSAYNLLECATSVSNAKELKEALKNPAVKDIEYSLPYGLFLHRRGFTFRYLSKKPDGSLQLGSRSIGEANEGVRKFSHLFRQYYVRWLTKK